MSNITIHGNLTADPDLRFSQGGKAWATFRVAENHRTRQGDKWVDSPSEFHNVKVFGQLAENIAESLKKGARVVVVGTTQTRAYTPEGSKESVTVVDIVADAVGASLQYATAKLTKAAAATVEDEPAQYDEADVPPAK
jgi:single-strand DNA-binding protein